MERTEAYEQVKAGLAKQIKQMLDDPSNWRGEYQLDDIERIITPYLSALPACAVDYEAGARAITTTLSSLGFPVPHRSDVLKGAIACINAALQPSAREA